MVQFNLPYMLKNFTQFSIEGGMLAMKFGKFKSKSCSYFCSRLLAMNIKYLLYLILLYTIKCYWSMTSIELIEMYQVLKTGGRGQNFWLHAFAVATHLLRLILNVTISGNNTSAFKFLTDEDIRVVSSMQSNPAILEK